MPDMRFTGFSQCPKCGEKSEILEVTSMPFPEEEIVSTRERCTQCNFNLEIGNFSSNATTAFDETVRREKQRKNVKKVVDELREMITAYQERGIRPDINGVKSAIQGRSQKDIFHLYVMLRELKKTPVGTICYDGLAELQKRIEYRRPFNDHMADWYDNEIRAELRGPPSPIEFVIDHIIEFVKMLESEMYQQKKISPTSF